MDSNGIDTTKQKPGTKLEIMTYNSVYDVELLDGENVIVEGGKLFTSPSIARFTGSTFGGGEKKPYWIGHMMCMQFRFGDKILTTTPAIYAKIYKDDWEYELEWD